MEDRDIIKLYFDRDERAVELTLKKYGSYCKSIAENILNGGEVAENCVKEALRQAWDSIPPQLPIVFPAFLGKLVRRISFEKYRDGHQGNPEMPLILDELGEIFTGGESTDEAKQRELLKAVGDYLYSIPVYRRNIFIRRYWYSDSVADIAKRYRRRENSVSDGLRKIRTSLSEYLLKKGIEPCGKEQFYRLFCDIDDTAVETASVTPEKNHPVRRLIISTAAALLVGLLIAAAVFFVNSMK